MLWTTPATVAPWTITVPPSRFAIHTAFKEPPDRARFTFGLLGEVLLRRPQAFKEACSFALSYQSLARYVDDLCTDLDRAIEDLERRASAA